MTGKSSDFTIGHLSRQTGCNIETIRYYEKVGLLPAPPRSVGGHRLYGSEHVRRLGFIRRGRQLGFSLDHIRALLDLADGEQLACGEVRAITFRHLRDVRDKIRDLKQLERTLTQISGACEGGIAPACPIIDALYRAAR